MLTDDLLKFKICKPNDKRNAMKTPASVYTQQKKLYTEYKKKSRLISIIYCEFSFSAAFARVFIKSA